MSNENHGWENSKTVFVQRTVRRQLCYEESTFHASTL